MVPAAPQKSISLLMLSAQLLDHLVELAAGHQSRLRGVEWPAVETLVASGVDELLEIRLGDGMLQSRVDLWARSDESKTDVETGAHVAERRCLIPQC